MPEKSTSHVSVVDSEGKDTDTLPIRGQAVSAPAGDEADSAWRWFARLWRAFLVDQVSPVRLASHMALLFIAGLVLVLSRVDLPRWEVIRVSMSQQPAEARPLSPAAAAEPVLRQSAIGGSPLLESGVLLRAAVPFTEIPDRPRIDVITYTVQFGDTVPDIAERFDLHPNTIVWANHDLSENPFLLEVGQELVILPVDGVYHTVKEGDTIKSVAKKYRVAAEKIVNYEPNGLDSLDSPLTPGQKLIVPDGDNSPPKPPGQQAPIAPWRAREMVWPAFGRITQFFWLPGHPAIDIGSPLGAVVRAADAGTVRRAGWSTVGYGNYVVIRHDDGFQTLYAHMNRIDVKQGDVVERGQQIGVIGSTGRSTGPHLHFEVSLNGRTYNPLSYLP